MQGVQPAPPPPRFHNDEVNEESVLLANFAYNMIWDVAKEHRRELSGAWACFTPGSWHRVVVPLKERILEPTGCLQHSAVAHFRAFLEHSVVVQRSSVVQRSKSCSVADKPDQCAHIYTRTHAHMCTGTPLSWLLELPKGVEILASTLCESEGHDGGTLTEVASTCIAYVSHEGGSIRRSFTCQVLRGCVCVPASCL